MTILSGSLVQAPSVTRLTSSKDQSTAEQPLPPQQQGATPERQAAATTLRASASAHHVVQQCRKIAGFMAGVGIFLPCFCLCCLAFTYSGAVAGLDAAGIHVGTKIIFIRKNSSKFSLYVRPG